MTLAERPRQTRAKAPRARTGCKPCKRRHIKCDEGKPSCQRCLVSGRACEGLAYSGVATQAISRRGPTYDQLSMRKDELWQLVTANVPAAMSEKLFSARDWDHFQYFIRMGTPYETLPKGSLQLLTPQVAHLVPAVKEVCCAVGALSRTICLTGKEATDALTESSAHYSKAAALLRSVVPTNEGLLSVCVASLMFTTYEMLSRRPDLACAHYGHAYLIFDQYLAKRIEEAGVPFADIQLTELEQALSDTLQRLGTYPWAVDVQPETPKTNSNLMSCCKGQPYTGILFRMPQLFDDMLVAGQWWDGTQHFIMHHAEHGRIGGAAEQTMWGQCVDTLHSWHRSFHPLMELSRREYQRLGSPKADSYIHGIMLKTLYLQTLGAIAQYHISDSNILPATKPLYREIVRVTRARLPEYGPFPDYACTTEKCLLRPLAYVLLKCKDPQVVDEVHDTLKMIDKPGLIAQALLYILGDKAGEQPLGSAMLGWTWDFLTSGHASVALTFEKDPKAASRETEVYMKTWKETKLIHKGLPVKGAGLF